VSRPGRALPPGKGPPVPIVQEAGWASEPVWTQRLEEKFFVLPGIEPRSSVVGLSYPGALRADRTRGVALNSKKTVFWNVIV
jgi:hypothetical protein